MFININQLDYHVRSGTLVPWILGANVIAANKALLTSTKQADSIRFARKRVTALDFRRLLMPVEDDSNTTCTGLCGYFDVIVVDETNQAMTTQGQQTA